MTNKVLCSSLLVVISHCLFGQTDFYLGVTGNYSFIPKIESIEESVLTDRQGNTILFKVIESYNVHPGFNLDFGFNKQLINKFLINSGIGFSLIPYKRNKIIESASSGVIWDTEDDEIPNYGKTKILYLVLPLRINYSLKPDKFRLSIGVTNYFIAYSSQISSVIDYTQPMSMKEYKDKSSDGLNNYQLNGNFSMEYKIFRDIWIQSSYSHGFLLIYDKPSQSLYQHNEKAKYRLLEFGLKYVL